MFSGFSLAGKVWSMASSEGPSGVTVSLQSKGGGNTTNTQTAAGGVYLFDAVSPGEYSIIVSHPEWTIENSTTDLVMGWGNVDLAHKFVVTGYEVRGRVEASGESIVGVSLLLYSTMDPPPQIKCKHEAKNLDLPPPLCSAVSSAVGEFSFRNIPPGDYLLRPHYQSAQSVFKVAPSELKVKVGHGSTVLGTVFGVLGFSVSGRAVSYTHLTLPTKRIV
eukprot:TRINITY_DN8774_c0_g1_i2.p1 TRINITY_DN8774_c0_g1~~TRINITY_DN8774_c0_g1_i2.p1  ORF type:complete len:219 (+),score=48.75 TRINITY_DN8774_c0_g1_i2:153-809(+)